MREGSSRLQARNIGNCRMRSDIEENLIGGEQTRSSAIQFHLKRFRRYKTPAAHDQFSTAFPIDLKVLSNLTFDHFTLASTNRGHVDSDGTGHRAIVAALTRKVCDFRARNLILAWHASDVGTGAANPASLHHGSPPSRLGHVPSDKLAARPTTKDENFQLL